MNVISTCEFPRSHTAPITVQDRTPAGLQKKQSGLLFQRIGYASAALRSAAHHGGGNVDLLDVDCAPQFPIPTRPATVFPWDSHWSKP